MKLTPIERLWVYNIQWITPILLIVGLVGCLMADSPGDNPGDNEALAGWMGGLMAFALVSWFANTMYRDCSNDYDRNFEGRRRRAIETRHSRYGRPKVLAIPDGEYVSIKTTQPSRVTCWPALWPLSQPFSCANDYSARRFRADCESEQAMEYFNEQEAKLASDRELSDGELEARALADALNS